MWAFDAQLVNAHRAPLALLEDGRRAGRVLPGESRARNASTRVSLDRIRDFLSARRRHALMKRFVERDGGYLVLLLLIRAADDRRHVSMSYGALARLAGASRTQVRLLIEDAERAGLVSLWARGGRHIEIHPRLCELVDCWIAVHIGFFSALSA
jgi:hypothetical protein